MTNEELIDILSRIDKCDNTMQLHMIRSMINWQLYGIEHPEWKQQVEKKLGRIS